MQFLSLDKKIMFTLLLESTLVLIAIFSTKIPSFSIDNLCHQFQLLGIKHCLTHVKEFYWEL